MKPPSAPPIRVLAVVHNRILREGICCLVETEPRLELEVAVSTMEDAVLQVLRVRPDLILLDLDLPGNSSLEAIRQLRIIDPSAWIIALITSESAERTREALAAGAADVLPKHLLGQTEWQSALGRNQNNESLKTGSNSGSLRASKIIVSI